MRIRKLAPSGRVEGRWLCHLEDGTILRLGESEVVAFGLGTGKELSGAELSALTEAARAAQVREKAVELLSARPLSRKELVEKLTALAQAGNIKHQMHVTTGGGTDAGVIHQSRLGVVTGVVAIPCRYTHTPTEMVDLSDVSACVELVTALAQSKL